MLSLCFLLVALPLTLACGDKCQQHSSKFPNGKQVGFAGPTATGVEQSAITAQASPLKVTKAKFASPIILPDTADKKDGFDVRQYLGNLSPMEPVKSFGLDQSSPYVPAECSLKQVHMFHRHGARYPTADSGPQMVAAKIKAAQDAGKLKAKDQAAFLNNWFYKLGTEILTPFGRAEVFDFGVAFRLNYADLVKNLKQKLVFRTTAQDRMLDSALNFAAGFFGLRTFHKDYNQLITIEGAGFNNTLAPYFTCPNSNKDGVGNVGSTQSAKWADIYLKNALARIQPMLEGIELTITDLTQMQQMCAYEIAALGFSPFCSLFTSDEWVGHKYWNDINFWYSFGPGNPTAGAQGIGYIQELISRLTQTRITSFTTTVNGTIVSDPELFPLDQPLFVDATHDTAITAILTAMNFTSLAASGPLPTDHIQGNQTYFVNQLAPFASNVVGQVLSCSGQNSTSIRWIVNDAVIPLTGIEGCKANKDGLCELDTFIKAMKKRVNSIDFRYACYGNYTLTDTDVIIDGTVPARLKGEQSNEAYYTD